MAVTFDAKAESTSDTSSSKTWQHTCSGSLRLLVVGVRAGSGTVTGVTYNSIAMNSIGSAAQPTEGSTVYLYYLLAPASGANNVVASFSGSVGNGGASVSYNGVKQSGQPDSSNTGTSAGPTDPFTLSTTVVAALSWSVAYIRNNGTSNAGTSTTKRTADIGGNVGVMYDSNANLPIGSQSLNIAQGDSSFYWAGVIASFAPNSTFDPSMSDTVTVSDAPSIVCKYFLSVSDSTAIGESITFVASKTINVSDSTAIGESTSFLARWPNQLLNASTWTNLPLDL